MSIPPQASFSSETTAVASRGTAYPSFEELTSFKLPLKAGVVESAYDNASDHSNEYKRARPLALNPSTPRRPSPATTEASDRDFTLEDTPSTIHGESMFYPRHPLANRTPSINVPVSPRWPFQNATPRTTVMVPIPQSITSSTGALNPNVRRSTIGHVSVSESLDEFQASHPNAQLLSLHPRPLTYSQTRRNLARIPELVEKPERNVQSAQGTTMAHCEKPPLDFFRGDHPSPYLLKIRLRRRSEKRSHSVKPKTSWYQRISIDRKVFRTSASITMFFLVNSFVSASALITLAAARLPVPHGIVVWVIVSMSTCAFTLTTLYLMRKFRNAVLYDEEHRGRSTHPKLSFDAQHMCNMDLPASPTEIFHRRQLGAAAEQEQIQADRMNSGSVMNARGSEMTRAAQPFPAGQGFNALMPYYPGDAIEDYWTDNSIVMSAGSEASSMTAVIPSTPTAAAMEKRQTGLFESDSRPLQDDGYDLSDLEFSRWDGWLGWD